MDKRIMYLKENFVDCTFGGEDEKYVKYDIGLENTFAHVDFNKDNEEIIVKIYDQDSILLHEYKFYDIEQVSEFLKMDFSEETDIMIRIHLESGEIRDTTLSHKEFERCERNARIYLGKILAPIPKNYYKGYEVFEIKADRTIIQQIAVYGELNK